MTVTHNQRRLMHKRRSSHCDLYPTHGSIQGFSLVELMVVLAVILVIGAFAIPTMTTAMDGVRIRGALGSASNIVQRCRAQAIKSNLYQRLHFAGAGNNVVLFVTDGGVTQATPAAVITAGKTVAAQVWLPTQFSIPGIPSGAGAPPKLTTLQMWGSTGVTLYENQDPYFTSRGMPCTVFGTACTTTGGFVYYYKYESAGRTRWAATSISPAGRIQSWIWDGSVWGN